LPRALAATLALAACGARHLPCSGTPPATGLQATASDGTCLQGYRWVPDAPRQVRGAVVVVHGLRDHAQRYGALGADLAREGFLVVAQDHRGHGRSGGRRQHFADVDDLVADVDLAVQRAGEEVPDGPLFLFGHSLGGLVATRYALAHPGALDGLVLTGPALMLPADVKPVEVRAAKLLSRLAPGLRVQELDDAAFVREAEAKAALAADPLVDHRDLPARSAGATIRAIEDVQQRLGEVSAPLLVLHGSEDPATNPDGSRALVAGAASADKALHVYPGASHDLLHEPERDEVRAEIVGWITARAPLTGTPE
jgi:acylglycerol lipase